MGFFFACGRRMVWTVGWRAKILKRTSMEGRKWKGEKKNGWILGERDESRGKNARRNERMVIGIRSYKGWNA